MNKVEKELLNDGIRKYKLKEYCESDFHSMFETVIGLLTESHSLQLRQKFELIEAKLEEIDFLSNEKREDYLRQIKEIENLLLSHRERL